MTSTTCFLKHLMLDTVRVNNNDDAEETELIADRISYISRLLEFRPSNPEATNPNKPPSDLPFSKLGTISKQLNTESIKWWSHSGALEFSGLSFDR